MKDERTALEDIEIPFALEVAIYQAVLSRTLKDSRAPEHHLETLGAIAADLLKGLREQPLKVGDHFLLKLSKDSRLVLQRRV